MAKKKSSPEKSSLPTQTKRRLPAWVKGLIVYCISAIVVVAAIFGLYSVTFNDQIYPRISVAGVMVGGLKPEAAKERLTAELAEAALEPVILTTDQGQSFTIKPEDLKATYNIDRSVSKAMAVGRDANFFLNLVQKLTTPLLGLDLPAAIDHDEAKLTDTLNSITGQIDKPEKNADLVIANGKVSISDEATGEVVESEGLREAVLGQLGRLTNEPIQLKIVTRQPVIRKDMVEQVKKEAEAILAKPILFTYQSQSFTADPAVIGTWLETKISKNLISGNIDLHFNDDKITKYLATLSGKIDQEPQDARLAVVDGQVKIIQSSKDGLKVNRDQAKTDLVQLLTIRQELPAIPVESIVPSPSAETSPLATSTSATTSPSPILADNQIALIVETKKPDVTDSNINEIGIKERIAISATDFKGSPANRQENIKVGTRLFNGIILKPGAQFSAIKSLGRIDESAGFKPELVIKQDELIPEVGGGLCQVSTTLFRAALNAGLKIDERRNHRFRVSYYEAKLSNPDPEDYVTLNAKTLVGLDATIYEPKPDFTFTNDTDNYILIQGRVEGTRLTFELFGTKDGRTVSIDGPYINSTTPAPTEIKYIDDPTLPAGTTKLKERPQAGAKTSVTYVVQRNGQQLHKNTFTSSYTPWQAKYYRGTGAPVEVTPSPEATPAATTDPAAATSPTPAP